MILERVVPTGDAERYILTADDGSRHSIIVSNAEKAAAPDGGKAALARAVARALLKAKTRLDG